MKKKETIFKERVIRDLRTISNIWFSKIQQVAICGTPDILACVGGKFVAIELKKSKNDNATPLQMWELECIAESHGLAFVTYPENWVNTFLAIKKLARHDLDDDYVDRNLRINQADN